MKYAVRFTTQAEEDLFDFLLEEDIEAADRAREAIAKATELLEVFPFSCHKAQGMEANPFLRELLIPFGHSGYVALFEIEGNKTVTILAVRHQREEDYQ
jgi:plasmid stabilization system protein ParE